MPGMEQSQLVNIIGHSAGAIIFGIFLVLLLRDRAPTGLRSRRGSLTAAALAFLWNIGSLAVLTHSFGRRSDLLVAFSFSVLSLLPAVLFDLSLDGQFRPIIGAGYALSFVAVAMHLWQLADPTRDFQRKALLLITVGFAGLTSAALIGLAVRTDREKRKKTSRMFAAMCSALLAISFVHFSSGHSSHPWLRELAVHHAGIPLALFVLLQDDRFVLLDAFIRFLTNAFLAAMLTFAAIRAASRIASADNTATLRPSREMLLALGLFLLLIVFALLRTKVQSWLTRAVFRRPELEGTIQRLRAGPAVSSDESEYLLWAAEEIGKFMDANEVRLVPQNALPATAGIEDSIEAIPVNDVPGLRRSPGLEWAQTLVSLRLSSGDVQYLVLGRRKGGRRYLSEDLKALNRLAATVIEQIDRLRTAEMQRLVSQAELRALQSQINPHFLFNALNTLYGIIPKEARDARSTVLNLAEIFRYFLQTEKTFIPLSTEIEIVKAYLEIESLRLGPRLRTDIQIDDAALPALIPILSIQPLVENAIKHGIAENPNPGWLRLRAQAEADFVRITVQDSGSGLSGAGQETRNPGAGVGLSNVEKRLELCYGPDYELSIDSSSSGTTVQFRVPVPVTKPAKAAY
ncbi:MAG TPA: histidine kinase [Acidobacteriaceae bacterium]